MPFRCFLKLRQIAQRTLANTFQWKVFSDNFALTAPEVQQFSRVASLRNAVQPFWERLSVRDFQWEPLCIACRTLQGSPLNFANFSPRNLQCCSFQIAYLVVCLIFVFNGSAPDEHSATVNFIARRGRFERFKCSLPVHYFTLESLQDFKWLCKSLEGYTSL